MLQACSEPCSPPSSSRPSASPPPSPRRPSPSARSCPPTPPPPRRSRAPRTPSPRRRPAPASPSAASPRCSTRPGATPTSRCPTTASARKANSRSFLLRVYRVRATGTAASVASPRLRSRLRDPRRRIPFELVNEDTDERYLTGGDFDVESVRRDRRGDLWFGDEFGPFLLHTDARGNVLEAPIPLPGVRSPDYPPLPAVGAREPRPLQRLRGHGDLARRAHAVPDPRGPAGRRRRQDDPADVHVRHRQAPLRRRPPRRTASRTPSHLVSDLTALDARRFVSLERDNFQGPAAVHKKAFVVDTRHGALTKREVLDQLDIADPERHLPARAGAARRLRARRPVQDALRRRSRRCCRSARASSRSSTTRTSARRAATRRCRTTATSSACGCQGCGAPLASAASPSCHSEKLISPHSCREWSSRRATWSSIRRVTAAGSK